MTDDEISGIIQGMGKADLISLLGVIRGKLPDVDEIIDEWFLSRNTKKNPASPTASRDRLALSYWDKVDYIVSSMNEYGGADDEEYETASELCEKIGELCKKGLSEKTRMEIFEDAFAQYSISNSGFDDNLRDLMTDLCSTPEDWRMFAGKLMGTSSRYDKEVAMAILLDRLHDEEEYLKLRKKKLEYGMEYHDLVLYYARRGDIDSAVATAKQGLSIGNGRLDELFDFLFEHYSGKRDVDGILSLIDTAMKRNDYEGEILYKAFLFFNKEGKYDKSLEIFDKLLEFRSGKFHDLFRTAQGALHSDDLAARTENILMKAKEREIAGYMNICMDLGFMSRVLEVLQDEQKQNFHMPFLFPNLDRFASALAETYPDQILDYFLKKALKLIALGKRQNYREAVSYLEKVEEIECSLKNDRKSWERRISGILESNRRRPVFIEEYRNHRAIFSQD
jgi:tetratricopeptide (TPR) repeat protein